MKAARQIIGPQGLPQAENVRPRELTLVPDQQHPKKEEEIGAVGGLKMQIQLRVDKLDQMIQSHQLSAHAGLIPEEIPFLDESVRCVAGQKGNGVIPFAP